jgi:hypothetical protein
MAHDITMRELLGPETTPEDAAQFLTAWHGKSPGLLTLTMLPSRRSLHGSTEDIRERLLLNGLDELVYATWGGRGTRDRRHEVVQPEQNVYVGAGWLTARPPAGKRGGKSLVGGAPGAWLDLDVDDAKFSSEAGVLAAIDRLDQLGVGPAIVVGSGSGGRHAYFPVKGGVKPGEAERLGRALRLLVEHEAGVAVDACENCDRIMRLPGSLRWPKTADEGRAPALVTLERCGAGRWLDVTQLGFLSDDLLAEADQRAHRVRERVSADDYRARRLLFDLGQLRNRQAPEVPEGGWAYRYELAMALETFNETVPWASILEPLGWTRTAGPDAEGRIVWSRPGGGSDRSAVCDWVESPDVMSLLSMAPETGLRELKEAGVPLTKARVAAQLWCKGDMGELLVGLMNQAENS